MITSSRKNGKPVKSRAVDWKLSVIIMMAVILLLSSCRTKELVVTRTEYRDRFRVDTVVNKSYDSIYIRQTGDTVREFRYKYIDRVRIQLARDTVVRRDTVTVVVPAKVKQVVQIKKVRGFVYYFGLFALIGLSAWGIWKLSKVSKITNIIQKIIKLIKI